MSNKDTHIEGPPPGTNGAGGPGDIPEDEKQFTHDTAVDGVPEQRDRVHE